MFIDEVVRCGDEIEKINHFFSRACQILHITLFSIVRLLLIDYTIIDISKSTNSGQFFVYEPVFVINIGDVAVLNKILLVVS